jgi:hypothetical protein
MTTSEDAILAYWKEHREQFRQSETQRSTFTNFLLAITAALSALIVQQRFSAPTIPLCGFIILLGVYGTLVVAKHYERASYHVMRARALSSTLKSMGRIGSNDTLDKVRLEHYQKIPHLHRMRLHHLWVALHAGIALYGTALLATSLAMF